MTPAGSRPGTFACLCLALSGLSLVSAGPAPIESTPLQVHNGTEWSDSPGQTVAFPGDASFNLRHATSNWTVFNGLTFDLALSAEAPTNLQVLVFAQDQDHRWYQSLLPDRPVPGITNHLAAHLDNHGADWTPQDHHGAWSLRALLQPAMIGIRVFGNSPGTGTVALAGVAAQHAQHAGPPAIRNVRSNTRELPCYERYEITFDLPDRYPNPFHPDEVRVDGQFDGPAGRMTVPGFYAQDFFRRHDPTAETLVPQGAPYWRIRFAPPQPGPWMYRIEVRDRFGTNTWGPGRFVALPPVQPGYVRVSPRDPRFFEFDNGRPFFPIGHNIRSPYDTRMEENFPWTRRWPAGSSVYPRYFEKMRAHGENLTEVWCSPWSLGLEWSPLWRGYHGIDQYNLENAWELDTVLLSAEQFDIFINLVIHNHGKFGTSYDREWDHNPLNVKCGGYLERPEDYFTDPRALDSFRRLMRYTIARWGYSTRIFAWEFWSELDLTGSDPKKPNHMRPETVEWHRLMGADIKAMDPARHLITTHVCGDYTHQNPDILRLPEIDHASLDAYHFNPDPLHIVELLRQTALHNQAFGKPVMVTEFGGSPYAADARHLEDTLHAGLWSSACIPLGGAPLFWWWQLVDEENFYPQFQALAAFMNGEDRRDPAQVMRPVQLAPDNLAARMAGQCLGTTNRVLGWLYLTREYPHVETAGLAPITNLQVRLSDMQDGPLRAEFWDTIAGRIVSHHTVTVSNRTVVLDVPPFRRDIAFKLKPMPE
ncbi:MAG: hypothetical protein A2498_04555 [Lentisphaerae bacterium RIFOXYC12_FULL_60_16]|nr:MAG: hypothetical protein A2498_04555 [Lentisphaerae bacterium RIFOXYC12_FULL_60_16]OGV84841.1 MAG: hypothetical protein A2340_16455 [Lentisphaerae bacterium RIFOXYB12_FULL_60_10]